MKVVIQTLKMSKKVAEIQTFITIQRFLELIKIKPGVKLMKVNRRQEVEDPDLPGKVLIL